MKKPRMLVHVCCAPDALYVMGLLQDNYDVTGYFCNPNIHPEEEYCLRLEETQKKSRQLNISKFTTTLTASPHKDTTIINKIGKEISPAGFLDYDFKKQDGFQLAIEFAKQYNLYRQNYCGCIYSKSIRR